MADPIVELLMKIFGLPETEFIYPRVVFSTILPGISSLIFFYGLNQKLQIFGKGTTNQIVSVGLALIFSYFSIKFTFVGYGVSCIGIAFMYIENDIARLLFVVAAIGAYWGLQFVL